MQPTGYICNSVGFVFVLATILLRVACKLDMLAIVCVWELFATTQDKLTLFAPVIDTEPDTSPPRDNVLAVVHLAADATSDPVIELEIEVSCDWSPSTFATV